MFFQQCRFVAVASFVFLASCASGQLSVDSPATQPQWVNLFDGTSLEGWRVHGGAHEFAVKGDSIVGTAVADQPNAFLVTQGTYSDFILEAEFLSDGSMNSGVIFRADSDPDYRDGRLYGYQADIDPSARGWTGGLFEEALRGWLVPIENNDACRASYRRDAWNVMRIEAVGSDLRTFVNNVPCARSVEDNLTEGVIGLQVHSVSPGSRMGEPGNWIAWRSIRILTEDPAGHRLP